MNHSGSDSPGQENIPPIEKCDYVLNSKEKFLKHPLVSGIFTHSASTNVNDKNPKLSEEATKGPPSSPRTPINSPASLNNSDTWREKNTVITSDDHHANLIVVNELVNNIIDGAISNCPSDENCESDSGVISALIHDNNIVSADTEDLSTSSDIISPWSETLPDLPCSNPEEKTQLETDSSISTEFIPDIATSSNLISWSFSEKDKSLISVVESVPLLAKLEKSAFEVNEPEKESSLLPSSQFSTEVTTLIAESPAAAASNNFLADKESACFPEQLLQSDQESQLALPSPIKEHLLTLEAKPVELSPLFTKTTFCSEEKELLLPEVEAPITQKESYINEEKLSAFINPDQPFETVFENSSAFKESLEFDEVKLSVCEQVSHVVERFLPDTLKLTKESLIEKQSISFNEQEATEHLSLLTEKDLLEQSIQLTEQEFLVQELPSKTVVQNLPSPEQIIKLDELESFVRKPASHNTEQVPSDTEPSLALTETLIEKQTVSYNEPEVDQQLYVVEQNDSFECKQSVQLAEQEFLIEQELLVQNHSAKSIVQEFGTAELPLKFAEPVSTCFKQKELCEEESYQASHIGEQVIINTKQSLNILEQELIVEKDVSSLDKQETVEQSIQETSIIKQKAEVSEQDSFADQPSQSPLKEFLDLSKQSIVEEQLVTFKEGLSVADKSNELDSSDTNVVSLIEGNLSFELKTDLSNQGLEETLVVEGSKEEEDLLPQIQTQHFQEVKEVLVSELITPVSGSTLPLDNSALKSLDQEETNRVIQDISDTAPSAFANDSVKTLPTSFGEADSKKEDICSSLTEVNSLSVKDLNNSFIEPLQIEPESQVISSCSFASLNASIQSGRITSTSESPTLDATLLLTEYLEEIFDSALSSKLDCIEADELSAICSDTSSFSLDSEKTVLADSIESHNYPGKLINSLMPTQEPCDVDSGNQNLTSLVKKELLEKHSSSVEMEFDENINPFQTKCKLSQNYNANLLDTSNTLVNSLENSPSLKRKMQTSPLPNDYLPVPDSEFSQDLLPNDLNTTESLDGDLGSEDWGDNPDSGIGEPTEACGTDSNSNLEVGVATVNRRTTKSQNPQCTEKSLISSGSHKEFPGTPEPLTSAIPNQSEAGPEVAQFTEEEFRCAAEVFKDPSAFEFLLKAGNSKAFEESALSRLSLYVKFDPLVKGLNKLTPVKEIPRTISTELQKKQSSIVVSGILNESATIDSTKNHAEVEEVSQKAADNATLNSSNIIDLNSPKHVVRGTPKMVPVEPLQRISEEKIQKGEKAGSGLTDVELKRALQYHEMYFTQRLLGKDKEINGKDTELQRLRKEHENIMQVMLATRQSYQEVVSMIRPWREKKEEEKRELVRERDQALEDMQNVETAFSDLHRRYEKSKQILETYKQKEDELRRQLVENQEQMNKQEQMYDLLRSRTEEKLESANTEIEMARKTGDSENAVMKAQLMKAEMKVSSLERTLEQKNQEFSQLSQIYDELIARFESQRT